VPFTPRQFGRVVQVEIVPPEGEGVMINPEPAWGRVQQRVRVSVTKGIGSPAAASVDIYNASKNTRDRAAGVTRRVVDFSGEIGSLDGRLVFGEDLDGGKAEVVSRANGFGFLRVSAFYLGSGAAVPIFVGTSKRVEQVGAKPTPITRITGTDGVIQDASAITNRQWRTTTDGPTVLEYVIREVMGTRLVGSEPGNFAAGLPLALAELELVGGYDATALFATDILDEFARVTRTKWWWDNGEVYWLDQGGSLPLPPLVLDSRPRSDAWQIVDKPTPGEDNKVDVPTLLLPAMIPGRLATIASGEFAGDYVASTVTHDVDNRGGLARTTARLDRVGVLPFE
jgi:hypothetical protein